MADLSAAVFHETTSGNKEIELINSSRNTTVQENDNFTRVFPDVIGFIQIAAQLFVAWTRSAGDQERDVVEISSITPPDPSSFPVFSIADQYTRSMLECLVGYPLYEPHPFSQLSSEYSRNGVNIGDVGLIGEDGAFDFIFNICPARNGSINPPNLPDGFSFETLEHSEIRGMKPLSPETRLFPGTVTMTESGEYVCEGFEGAILELPEGAIQDEATTVGLFEGLAKHHGMGWYKYTIRNRGKNISNGSLYLITSFTKCTHWGMAVCNQPCKPGQGLTFVHSPFGWEGSRGFTTKVADTNKGDTPNQCVFLRGYKIMIRQDIFDNLRNYQSSNTTMPSSSLQDGNISLTRQQATRIRDSGGTDFTSRIPTGKSTFDQATISTATKFDKVVIHPKFNSPVHPSDLINAELLSQNPDAKVALTHDDVWCDLLRNNFPKLNYARLMDITRSYTSTIDEFGCVSLEKLSYPSDVLSSPLLQGTETQASQAPLCTPDDEYTFDTISLILPRELVERILLLLDYESILTCKLVNREFNETIQSSTLLQYFLACQTAGVIDNPQSPLSYAERLEALKVREDAWRKLKPVFETTISVIHQAGSQICRSTEGVYFLSDNNLKDLYYCRFTSFLQGNPQWIRIPGHGPTPNWSGILLNFAAALYEHDLIVNLISSDIGNQADMQWHSLDLVLLKFSTGEYHPLARRPQIHVQTSSEVEPWVVSAIVGDNFALTVHSTDGTFSDKLFIFDWKTGHKLLQHEATENAYSDLVFISPELLLVTNPILSHFEVWHLPHHQLDANPPTQILSLQIPAVSPDYSLFRLDCYGEPNPFLHFVPYFPPQPFMPSPENSIIMIQLGVWSSLHQRASYNLVMHRRALLDTIQTWTSPSFLEQQEELPMWLTNEVIVHQTVDPVDGSVELDAHSNLVSTMPQSNSSPRIRGSPTFATSHTSLTFPTSHISATDSGFSSVSSGSSTNSSTSRYTFLQVPWAKWGPPISRWFQVNETQAPWISHSSGQRYAFSDYNPLDKTKLMISVADFNPHNVRRNPETTAQLQSGEGENNGNNANNEKEEEFEILDHKGVFSEEVYMGLKCVVHHAPDEYDFDVVSMDEQRLFGLKLNYDRNTESIKVLHIG